jgi:hypothetical protein
VWEARFRFVRDIFSAMLDTYLNPV